MTGSGFTGGFSKVLLLVLLATVFEANGQEDFTPDELKRLSVAELLDVEVTSVSRHSEKLAEVASAIQVVSHEAIARSAATNIPDALRLAPNLQVAQFSSFAWMISSRGFNSIFANKLLVMIDGRSVYTPLFAGVYWDAQQVLLEDIDRIEVISGPGGTLWGANAVNGVINIITRDASETQGLYVSGAAGSLLRDHAAVRYGGSIGEKVTYRVFAQHADRNNTLLENDADNRDKWGISQAGMRIDWNPSERSDFSMQSNFYMGEARTDGGPPPGDTLSSTFDGQNILARWSYAFSDQSQLVVQGYYDRTWRRDPPSTISDELTTYDLDIHHRFSAGTAHNILWGVGYRRMNDRSQNSTDFAGFVPAFRDMDLYSAFIQDEIAFMPELKLTVGSKFLHNVYTGFEVQPSVRFAWLPRDDQTVWAAVSRAVRTPSRFDVDYRIPVYDLPDNVPHVVGGPNFVSEKVVAYETGYRVNPNERLSLSLALFYNMYDDLYSVETRAGTAVVEILNGMEGESYGLELSGVWEVMDHLRMRGGYTYFDKTIRNKPGHMFDPSYAGYDPKHLVLLQLMSDLPGNFEADVVARFVGRLPESAILALEEVPSYFNFDARLAWVYQNLEVSLCGQNIIGETNREYGTNKIPRNIYGKIALRL